MKITRLIVDFADRAESSQGGKQNMRCARIFLESHQYEINEK
jgi:hypothetical protein